MFDWFTAFVGRSFATVHDRRKLSDVESHRQEGFAEIGIGTGVAHGARTMPMPQAGEVGPLTGVAVGENPVPLVNIKIGGTRVFICSKMEA